MVTGWGGSRRGAGSKPALSDWEVDELLMMRRRGASLAEIATAFSLSERTVRRYLRRREGGEGS